jgi:hypothetical protein
MSSPTRADPRRSGFVRELLLVGLSLWMCTSSALVLAQEEHPAQHAGLAVITVVAGIGAVVFGAGAMGRWRRGERVALTHAGPAMAAVELLLGGSMTRSALSMAGREPLSSSLIGVAGIGMLVAGALDAGHWLRRRRRVHEATR